MNSLLYVKCSNISNKVCVRDFLGIQLPRWPPKHQLYVKFNQSSSVVFCRSQSTLVIMNIMGFDATHRVFGVSDKPRPKSSETSKKIVIWLVASLDMILSKKMNNKDANQTARMRSLVCTFVVRKPPPMQIFARRGPCV